MKLQSISKDEAIQVVNNLTMEQTLSILVEFAMEGLITADMFDPEYEVVDLDEESFLKEGDHAVYHLDELIYRGTRPDCLLYYLDNIERIPELSVFELNMDSEYGFTIGNLILS